MPRIPASRRTAKRPSRTSDRSTARASAKSPAIVPQPVRLLMTPGRWRAGVVGRRTVRIDQASHAIAAVMALLAELPVGAVSVDPSLPPHTLTIAKPAGLVDPPPLPQGYALEIWADGVVVRGHDSDGLFYGLVTLEQLLDQPAAPAEFACVRIWDHPMVQIRYHHDDLSRGQISTPAGFRAHLRRLSRFKVNFYTPYIEDVLHLRGLPDIGSGRGKLMPDEVRSLLRTAAACNITVFPTISLAGHHEHLLRLPAYQHLGKRVWQRMSTLDANNPQVRPFIETMLDEACTLFPGTHFHMAFDETQGLPKEDFLEHANWCAEQLVRRGCTPLMWVDMIYNHFGYDAIHQLHPAIRPVNWQYGRDTLSGVPHQNALQDRRAETWGLAAYSGTQRMLPDTEPVRDNLDGWATHQAVRPGGGFGCSVWGDDGYENSRQLPWDQYAYFAERAWTGPTADRSTFDDRFERVFYGTQLPALRQAVGKVAGMSVDPPAIWSAHRRNPQAMFRMATAGGRKQAKSLRADQRTVAAAGKTVASARRQAVRNADVIDTIGVAIDRTASVIQRLAAAHDGVGDPTLPAKGARAAARAAATIAEQLAGVRDRFAADWIAHNKPQGLEVPAAVFDRLIGQYQRLASTHAGGGSTAGPAAARRAAASRSPVAGEIDPPYPTDPEQTFVPLDFGRHWDVMMPDIAGVPIGVAVVNQVPMRFPPAKRTFASIPRDKSITLRFPECRVADLHLVAATGNPPDRQPAGALRLELMNRGDVVFTEDLQSIRHLLDWWAPLADHIWAGGGLTYVDPYRVQLALRPDYHYGLGHTHRFGLAGSPAADAVRLTGLAQRGVHVFALTVQKVPPTQTGETAGGIAGRNAPRKIHSRRAH